MDIFAHGLWTFGVFHKKKYAWWATLFGILPDLLSFGILFAANIVHGNFQRGRPSLSGLPDWLYSAYNMTHSFVVFLAVFLIIYLTTKKWFWPLTAWAIHILIDIPTHSTRFFPTPFLWPLYNIRFNGISWGTGWFMLLNYGSLMVVFLIIARNRAREKLKKKNKKYLFTATF